jgi:soluble lytic murein transglycosylase
MWECVYPRPYSALVREVAQQQLLPEKLLHSIMRQESGFRPRVVSPAGAIGLMQLMPGTGARVAGELNLSFVPRLLESPTYNVRFGGHYLKKLVDMFGGNVALAAAGYNAGPMAVFRWIDGGKDLPLDLFVARIPFEETRGYVERVVGNLARYSFLSGGEGEVPKIALDLPRDLKEPGELY